MTPLTLLISLVVFPALAGTHGATDGRFTCSSAEYQELNRTLAELRAGKDISPARKKELTDRLAKEASSACATGNLRHDLESALVEAGRFPCDLSRAPKSAIDPTRKPRIRLLGERHDSCPLCDKQRDKQEARAKAGEFLFAREGLPFERPAKNAKDGGIEDPFIFGMNAAFLDRFSLYSYAADPTPAKRDAAILSVYKFLKRIDGNSEVANAWTALPRPFVDKTTEKLAADIDNYLAAAEPEKFNLLQSLVDQSLGNQRDAAKAILSKLSRELYLRSQLDSSIKRYRTPHDAEAGKAFAAILLRGEDEAAFDAFMKIFSVKWRDESMAQNIARLFCEAAFEGTDVESLFGLEHLLGVHEHLSKMLKSSCPAPCPIQLETDSDLANHDHIKSAPPGSESAKLKEFLQSRAPSKPSK